MVKKQNCNFTPEMMSNNKYRNLSGIDFIRIYKKNHFNTLSFFCLAHELYFNIPSLFYVNPIIEKIAMRHKKLQGGKELEDRISPALFPGTEGIADIDTITDHAAQSSDGLESNHQKDHDPSNESQLNPLYTDEPSFNDFNSQNQLNFDIDTSDIEDDQADNFQDQQFFSESANDPAYFDSYDVLSAEFSDNAHEIWYNDGSGIISDETGSVINWDEDGSYHYHGIDGTQCHYHADGSGSYLFPDQSIATWNADGSGIWHGSDGSEGVYHSDHSGKIVYPEGTALQWNADGEMQFLDTEGQIIPENQFAQGEFINTDGSIDFWHDDGTISKTEMDGTVRNYYPDSSGETIYPDGTVEKWGVDGTYTYEGSDGINFTMDVNGRGRIFFADGYSDSF